VIEPTPGMSRKSQVLPFGFLDLLATNFGHRHTVTTYDSLACDNLKADYKGNHADVVRMRSSDTMLFPFLLGSLLLDPSLDTKIEVHDRFECKIGISRLSVPLQSPLRRYRQLLLLQIKEIPISHQFQPIRKPLDQPPAPIILHMNLFRSISPDAIPICLALEPEPSAEEDFRTQVDDEFRGDELIVAG
jgi:hypothetical protein